MNAQYPKDCPERRIESKSEKIFHYKLNTDHWLYRQETGNDYGRDCVIELSENDEWHNKKIECQIKGTTNPKYRFNNTVIAFSMDIKTINYALRSVISFILVLVDLGSEEVYYLPIHNYFKNNPDKYERLTMNQGTVDVHIPVTQILTKDDKALQELAAQTF